MKYSAQIVLFLVAALVATISTAEQFSFEDYKVWQVQPANEDQQKVLLQWQSNADIDFWDSPNTRAGEAVRVMVAPTATREEFLLSLRSSGIAHELIIDNVERTLQLERAADREYRRMERETPRDSARIVSDFNHFWSLEEIDQYVSALERLHPDLVSTETIGNSTEQRPLRIVNISLRGRGVVDGSRPIVFIDAGIHAREWVAHHAGLYILKQLVENRADNLHILENIDLVVLPLVNPDGYAFSRETYRFWRKTRTPYEENEIGRVCYGTDGNRNFEYMWRSAEQTRVTTCNETYPGVAAFSEPETQAVRFVLDRHSTDIKLYASLHTYGNWVLYPWGFERTRIDNWRLHERIGHIFADPILEATGTNYTVVNSAIGLYPAYGGSDDYAAFVGVQAAFTLELTGGGRNGFDLPAYHLQRVMEEFWLGMDAMLTYAGVHDWEEYTLE